MTTGPSFRFRLERVRALRERKEELARRELAAAIVLRSRSSERLRAVTANLERANADQLGALRESSAVSGDEMCARQAFLERVEAQRAVSVRELDASEAVLAERGAELGRAAREHEMLERLKERRRVEHNRELDRREGLALDDLALDRFRRSAA